ncbi:unnamed protein product [Rhizophagus irregularis]|nr:unnamed protein product [Rhizophagus irregularis]
MDYSTIKPFIDQFSKSQIQSILIAWLPTKLSPYLTGIMTVNMFAITVIASGPYNDWNKNIIYESLLWLISDQTKKLYEGIFILNVLPNLNNKNKNIIPDSKSRRLFSTLDAAFRIFFKLLDMETWYFFETLDMEMDVVCRMPDNG